MSTQLNHVEEAAVRECLRDAHAALGIKNLKYVPAKLVQVDPKIDEEMAREFIYRRSVKSEEQKEIIVRAAITLLKSNVNAWMSKYDGAPTRDFLFSILADRKTEALPAPRPVAKAEAEDYLSRFVGLWRSTFNSESEALRTGIYQTMRRYKPPSSEQKGDVPAYDWTNAQNHAVIVELLLINAERMECVCITWETNIYRGSITLNHEDMLYGAMVRVLLGNSRTNFRFFALKVEGRGMSLASGLIVKAGDTSKRPIAAESIFARVPPREHVELYETMQAIDRGMEHLSDRARSVLSRYLTAAPPDNFYDPADPDPMWKRVKFVREFPIISRLVKSSGNPRSLLREPSRALSYGNLIGILHQAPVPIFQWNEEPENSAPSRL